LPRGLQDEKGRFAGLVTPWPILPHTGGPFRPIQSCAGAAVDVPVDPKSIGGLKKIYRHRDGT